MDDRIYTAVERALAGRAGEWLQPSPGGRDVRFDVAARIAVDAAAPLLGIRPAGGGGPEALRAQLHRLEARVAKLEAVADAVQVAAIRDHNVYGEIPDEDWLAIDRDDVARIIGAMADVDRWQPWRTVLERRLGDV